jgi:hypothetical protein
MKSLVSASLATLVLVVMIIAGSAVPAAGTSSEPRENESQVPTSMPGKKVVRIADDRYRAHRVLPPRRADMGLQDVDFEFQWNPASCPATTKPWPQQAKDAFYYAAGIWGSLLDSSQRIEVLACWLPESAYPVPRWIGAAGPVDIPQDFPNAPLASTRYAVALANALAQQDLNGARAEIDSYFNADRTDWYFGTDGSPAPDELDFATLVLHELGHGLGFFGFAEVDRGDNACDTHTPGDGCFESVATYDRFTRDGGGNLLLDYDNPSAQLGQALTGQAGGVFFDGPEATAANSGPVRLYGPSPWNDSSYSHLDEGIFNPTPNSLMTPIQNVGEVDHHPGPVTLAMFQDMGWGAVNTAPTLSGLPDQLVAVDGVADDALDLWDHASDGQSPASALTYSIVGEPAPNAGVSLDSNRYIDIRPAAGWSGATQVTVQATDPGGLSDTDSFLVTVAETSNTYLPLVQNGWASPPPDWTIIVSEDFEGAFPGDGWQVVDENSLGGLYHWGRRDCRSSSGSFSAWSVGAGDTTFDCGSDYPGEVAAWMVYGPFSLADATAAELVFDWWSDTAGGFDKFFFGASTDDYNYRGVYVKGDYSSWTIGERFDLGAVPEFGSLLGEEQVWIGFSFESDSSVAAEGAHVDNVVVRKRVGGAGSNSPSQNP